MQPDLFNNSGGAQPQVLPLPDADVTYYPQWLEAEKASVIEQQLKDELHWHQDTIKIYGRLVKIPRLQAWHGDHRATYSYSGLAMTPQPWTSALGELKDQLAGHCHTSFNSVLANWYRDGQDSMGMHADDEPELGPEPVIASLTFGQARPFIFKHQTTRARSKVVLEHGSLLVMRGRTQQHYHHGIAKTTQQIGDRINLTFRHIFFDTGNQ
ncbi:alpha-ketoglutarate-dependent dioxygenase AlkB family protein [Salinimonas chungwhensis]|uniref:alpha-ketoglutarate-dependent dioxygenase AlkB family protein n=1 Tax=Salinimonas chungwhensis TaxID=265425 RepID=UPI0003655549|nr:alpha-ketoglutarate-dependent dioxygenase AlkB [Salinimonas chungwhensis]